MRTPNGARTTALIAGVLAGGIAIREWFYVRDHPHAFGPALWIALLGVAGVVVSLAVAECAKRIAAHDDRLARLERQSHLETPFPWSEGLG